MIDDRDRHAMMTEDEEPEAPVEVAEEEAAPLPTFAKIVLKRNGVETDIEYPVTPSSVVGRFDPDKGPIEIDLGPLPEAVYISRKHARFDQEDDVWKITDLGSSNGTFVLKQDFERVETADLEDGTEIAFGNVRFVFKLV
jgi:pSer/pThr/pTyr-binding forkhead associated (FHA) protein